MSPNPIQVVVKAIDEVEGVEFWGTDSLPNTAEAAISALAGMGDITDEEVGAALALDTDADPLECPGVMGEECLKGRHHHHSKGHAHIGNRETCELWGCIADRARGYEPTGTYPAVRALIAQATAPLHARIAELESDRATWKSRAEGWSEDYTQAEHDLRAAEARIVADAALANTMILESDARAEAAEARVAELEADLYTDPMTRALARIRELEATVERVRTLCATPMRAVDFMEAVSAALADPKEGA